VAGKGATVGSHALYRRAIQDHNARVRLQPWLLAGFLLGCAPTVTHVLVVQAPPTYSITCRSRERCHVRAGELCPYGFEVADAGGDTRGHTTSTGQYWENTDHTMLVVCRPTQPEAPEATAPAPPPANPPSPAPAAIAPPDAASTPPEAPGTLEPAPSAEPSPPPASAGPGAAAAAP